MIENLKFPVVDWFRSFQGEGLRMGRQTWFIRLFGCNLKCEFCDEPLHMNSEEIKWMSVEDIVSQARAILPAPPKHHKISGAAICFTGGEPLLHPIDKLILPLRTTTGLPIQIETNGTQEIDWNINWAPTVHMTVAPKVIANYKIADSLWPWIREIKLVCNVNNCYDVVGEFFNEYEECVINHRVSIFLQPENKGDKIDKSNLAMCIKVANEFKLHVSPQIHKMIGVA